MALPRKSKWAKKDCMSIAERMDRIDSNQASPGSKPDRGLPRPAGWDLSSQASSCQVIGSLTELRRRIVSVSAGITPVRARTVGLSLLMAAGISACGDGGPGARTAEPADDALSLVNPVLHLARFDHAVFRTAHWIPSRRRALVGGGAYALRAEGSKPPRRRAARASGVPVC